MTNVVRAIRSIAFTPAMLLALSLSNAAVGQGQPLERFPNVQSAPGDANSLLGAPDPRRDVRRYAAYVQGLVDPFWAGLFLEVLAWHTSRPGC